jgi:hypothetical protein
LDGFCETWPASGSMQSGSCYPRPRLAPTTAAKGFSYWPTPTASDAKRVRDFSSETLIKVYLSRPTEAYLSEALMAEFGWFHHPGLSEWLMGLPIGWTDCTQPATPYT